MKVTIPYVIWLALVACGSPTKPPTAVHAGPATAAPDAGPPERDHLGEPEGLGPKTAEDATEVRGKARMYTFEVDTVTPTTPNQAPAPPAPMSVRRSVSATVRQHLADLAACYRQALAGDPTLEGSLQLVFKVEVSGHVSATEIIGTGTDALHACVKAVVQALAFAPADDGVTTTVTYPLALCR